MYCPECGTDAADANYCPECGNDLTPLAKGATKTQSGRSAVAQTQRHQRPRTARRAAARQEAPRQAPSKRPTILIWGGFVVAAAIVVVIVAMAGGGGSGSAPAAGTGSVTADTSGSYSELVGRANGLYDQGIAAFSENDAAAGEENFRSAAEVYTAAWKKQPGDPNVGTDLAVSLFYSRHHDEAMRQVNLVLKDAPDFQPAHLNKGIFLKTESAESKEAGEAAKAAKFLAQAKLAFERAVSIDRDSDTGRRAAELLKSL